MKRSLTYIFAFMFMSLVFCAGYYRSYKKAYDKLLENNKTVSELNEDILRAGTNQNASDLLNASQTLKDGLNNSSENEKDKAFSENYQVDNSTEVLSNFSKVMAGAKMKIENYYLDSGESTFYENSVPVEFVGLTRKELIASIYEYMLNMPLDEYEKGLYSYEITYFSNREIGLKKSYNPDLVTFKYYVAVKDGYVIVYHCDLKTVYEYTSIVASILPEKERNRLMAGIYLKTNEELYELLENYSS